MSRCTGVPVFDNVPTVYAAEISLIKYILILFDAIACFAIIIISKSYIIVIAL